ncbi:MAG: RNA 2',3'-cyclic phosphodiesterase [Bryobacteraceae bacterium]
MRLFTGIDLPEQQTDLLTRLLDTLRPSAAVRWSKPANLHVTTKFVGEWPEGRLPELNAALGGMETREPFSIALSGLGWFPNPHQPRIFWAAVRGGEPLANLAAATERALEPVGVPVESRPYTPHLTLARVPAGAAVAGLRRAVAELESTDFGTWTATGQVLYLSEPAAGGSHYSPLARFPFAGGGGR